MAETKTMHYSIETKDTHLEQKRLSAYLDAAEKHIGKKEEKAHD